jgi:hypothetical protein
MLRGLWRFLTCRPKHTLMSVVRDIVEGVGSGTVVIPGVDSRIGVRSLDLYPGYGWCGRCQTAWPLAPYHVTRTADDGGCFPLCELCWQELGTPDARLPHYRALWDQWVFNGTDKSPGEWDRIEAAVRAGG